MMFLATKLQSYLIIHVTREYRYGRGGGGGGGLISTKQRMLCMITNWLPLIKQEVSMLPFQGFLMGCYIGWRLYLWCVHKISTIYWSCARETFHVRFTITAKSAATVVLTKKKNNYLSCMIDLC